MVHRWGRFLDFSAGLLLLCLAGGAGVAAGQGTISATNRYAYAANAGWIDFSPWIAADNVAVGDTFLAGFAYAANFGYIHFGSGAPVNGHTYGNGSVSDYGVNVSASGELTGYAYAPNIGYIQFEQTLGLPKLNLITGQFTGYAYSANIGWIALDTSLSDLVTATINHPDPDGDGIPDSWEKLYFGNLTTATAVSDKDGDGAPDLAEYRAGTNPTTSASVLRIASQAFNAALTQATLTFTTVATRRYRIEYDNDLVAPWTDSSLGTFTVAGNPTETKTITVPAGAARRFFRVVAVSTF